MNKILAVVIFAVGLNALAQDTSDVPVKEWTILTYINGYNSLDSFGEQNIKSMEQVGSSDQLNVVVEWGSMADTTSTKRLYVTKSTDPTKVTSKVVDSFPVVDMGDYKTLSEFIKWGVTKYPAKHYFVVVWNHGNGWHLESLFQKQAPISSFDLSFDDNSGHAITTEQLAQVMADAKTTIGHNVDVYGSDACLMAMGEVAAQMAGSVDYFVGSEETEPGAGWPYQPLLARWAASPAMSPADVAKMVAQEYTKSYSGGVYGTEDVTFSAYDMSKIDQLYASVKALGAKLANANMSEIVNAAAGTQAYALSDYKDLADFVDHVKVSSRSIDVVTEANAVRSSIGDFVIENQVTSKYANSHGVAIWLADSYNWGTYSTRYQSLVFNQKTGWADFLAKYAASNGK